MAFSRQVACAPSTNPVLADETTVTGGPSIIILNSHATEPLFIHGNENATKTTATGMRIPAGTYSPVIKISGNEAIYGLTGTTTVTITAHVFRFGI